MRPEEVLRIVEERWDREVAGGCGWTVPWLSGSRELVAEFAAGRGEQLPGLDDSFDPRWVLAEAAGKEVLCLASGGGQQSAAFGLLGARVTVLDLCEGQLQADRAAAEHYGYEVRTVKGDAADLSAFAEDSFDLVYQACSVGWMPDVRRVYREVYRVVRRGGRYRVALNNPAVHAATFEGGRAGWDGVGYRIADRFRGGPVYTNAAGVDNWDEGTPTGDHAHLLRDSIGGLLDCGFTLRYVGEDPCHLREPVTGAPGSWEHALYYLGLGVNVVGEKG